MKKCKVISRIFILLGIVLGLFMCVYVVTSTALNRSAYVSSYNINVKISYKITLDTKIKNVNPNIIKATRQALFDYDCNNAKFTHYDGFVINNDVHIFEVNYLGKNTWGVKFWEKPHNTNSYNKSGYCFASIQKQKSGSFKGNIMNPGGPMIRGGETY